MKKKKYLFIFLFILLVGCGYKGITKEVFIDKATYNGYILKEDKSGYETYDDIKSVSYAINREDAYNIQFLELSDTEYAHKFFLLNKNEIKENITSVDYYKSKSSSNYELYHAENSSQYYLVIRSETNIIYIDAPIGYINEIEEFLDDLGLDY